jgi:hypothetical protein
VEQQTRRAAAPPTLCARTFLQAAPARSERATAPAMQCDVATDNVREIAGSDDVAAPHVRFTVTTSFDTDAAERTRAARADSTRALRGTDTNTGDD